METHFLECTEQDENKPCICSEIQEEKYNKAIDAQIDDLVFNLA